LRWPGARAGLFCPQLFAGNRDVAIQNGASREQGVLLPDQTNATLDLTAAGGKSA
jgi:hypothetical protein